MRQSIYYWKEHVFPFQVIWGLFMHLSLTVFDIFTLRHLSTTFEAVKPRYVKTLYTEIRNSYHILGKISGIQCHNVWSAQLKIEVTWFLWMSFSRKQYALPMLYPHNFWKVWKTWSFKIYKGHSSDKA